MRATASTGPGTAHSGAGQPETIRFPVSGMTCTSCVSRITRALKRLDGVERVRVDLRDETVTIRRDPSRTPAGVVAAAIVEAGYEPDLSSAALVTETEPPGILGRWLRR